MILSYSQLVTCLFWFNKAIANLGSNIQSLDSRNNAWRRRLFTIHVILVNNNP